jgi:uncharacterized protein (TIGR02391 family)
MNDQIEILKEYDDKSILVKCAFCDASGVFPKLTVEPDDVVPTEPCPVCRGRGTSRIKGDLELLMRCRYCSGSGKGWDDMGMFMGEICPVCKGRGIAFADSAPVGDSTELDSFWSMLHPLVVKVSSSRFNAGHYADAVEAALKEVNSIVKQKVKHAIGQEFDGANLMQRALSLENPIIRMADLSSESGKDIQKGYLQIFAGAMTGIRNPKAHGNIDLDKRRAIHLLFFCSLLMEKLFEFNDA